MEKTGSNIMAILLLLLVIYMSSVSCQLLPLDLSEECQTGIKPDTIVCIDENAVKWNADLKKEPFDGKACSALWDVMCCVYKSKNINKCNQQDMKILEDNFNLIQKRLEITDCKDNKRNAVKCLN